MTNAPESDAQPVHSFAPASIGLVMVLLAVLAPLAISVMSFEQSLNLMVIAMMWQANYAPYGSRLYFDPGFLLASLPFTFLRIFFVYMMIRTFQGKTTKKRALMVGVAGELQLVVIYNVTMLFFALWSPMPFVAFVIPSPLLLSIACLIIHFYPPPKTTVWIEEIESKSWWDRSPEERTEESEPTKTKEKPPTEIDSPW